MCMFECPIYSVYRNDVFSPKGKINAIDFITTNKNKINKIDSLSETFRECNMCGHCTMICPGEVEITKLVVDYRNVLNKIKPNKNYERIMNNIKLFGNPYGLNLENKKIKKKNNNGKDNILLFFGCTARYKLPEKTLNSVLGFLDKLSINYSILEDEPCCGNILYNLGYSREAKTINEKVHNVMKIYSKVITICPGCYNMFKTYKQSDSKLEVFHILEVIHDSIQQIKNIENDSIYLQVPCHVYNSDRRFKLTFKR